MLTVKLDEREGIAILEPHGKLSAMDFQNVAKVIDPYIEQSGKLNGVIIHVKSFPGWESFSALVRHLKFVRDHHRDISHVAFATDSPIGALAEHVGNHFVSAEVQHFLFNELELSKKWIMGSEALVT